MDKIKEEVINIIAKVMEISPSEIGLATTIDSTPMWNSMNHLCLINELEKFYQIKFSLDEALELIGYEAIITIMRKKLSLL